MMIYTCVLIKRLISIIFFSKRIFFLIRIILILSPMLNSLIRISISFIICLIFERKSCLCFKKEFYMIKQEPFFRVNERNSSPLLVATTARLLLLLLLLSLTLL